MKLLIVGWYNLIYPVITAKEYFTILGYDVYFLPLLYYTQQFSENKLNNALLSFIKNIDPLAMLWWNWECPTETMKFIKQNTQNVVHLLFNWDHPFCLSNWDNNLNRQILSKNIWDICFVTGDCKLNKYIESGSSEAYYLRMFSDEETHFPEYDKNYECDVSIVCTNLYDDVNMFPNTILSRKDVLTNIINNNINLHIYGPENLKKVFPKQYKGFCHFLDNHKIFYNSKINLCTHVENGYKYCNERVGSILSSGGLLFCDKVEGITSILTDNVDCILIDETNYINQLKEILANYQKYAHIRFNAIKTAGKKFSPNFWCKYIDVKLKNYLQNNINKNFKITNLYNFNNYQPKKITIVMSYYNRIQQFINTLDTIQETHYPKELIEVVCVDDRSDKEPLIMNLSSYSYKIKITYSNFERDEKIINPTYAYNNAFKYIDSEYVIIQNSECMHIGDIISYACNNIQKNTCISFPCWASANESISCELFNNRHNSSKMEDIINKNFSKLHDYPTKFKGWYNEKMLRPECLHFCNAMHINTFKNIGLFNVSINKLLGFDDNDYAERTMFNNNVDIIIPEHNYELFVVHQYHGKYNKPRPEIMFLDSYDKYRKIDNNRINNCTYNVTEKIITKTYSEIDRTVFLNQLNNEFNIYTVVLIISKNQFVDISFIRKCLKCSNFRLITE
jgi:hypothetical protein